MGLFDMFKSKEKVNDTQNLTNGENQEYKVNLLKEREQKVKISLEKKTLEQIQANVVLALDVSGSMRTLYNNHTVQDIVERIVPIATTLDSDKQLDSYIFSRGFSKTVTINRSNYLGYIDKSIIKSNKYNNILWSSTNYSGFMKDIYDRYHKSNIPTLVIVFVDGGNDDQKQTEDIIKVMSNYPIFIEFVGIGSARFEFLEKLDNLTGRTVDNANFFAVNDVSKISDEELYDKLMCEFPSWIREARVKGILK